MGYDNKTESTAQSGWAAAAVHNSRPAADNTHQCFAAVSYRTMVELAAVESSNCYCSRRSLAAEGSWWWWKTAEEGKGRVVVVMGWVVGVKSKKEECCMGCHMRRTLYIGSRILSLPMLLSLKKRMQLH